MECFKAVINKLKENNFNNLLTINKDKLDLTILQLLKIGF